MLTKEEIWDRIRVKSVWLMPTRTPFFVAGEEHMKATNHLQEQYRRYIVCLLFQGNAITAQSAKLEQLGDDADPTLNASFTMKWSDIQIQPSAMPQIPDGAYSITDPIISLEGGTNLYGTVNGNSINATVTYWDSEV